MNDVRRDGNKGRDGARCGCVQNQTTIVTGEKES